MGVVHDRSSDASTCPLHTGQAQTGYGALEGFHDSTGSNVQLGLSPSAYTDVLEGVELVCARAQCAKLVQTLQWRASFCH